MRRSLFDDDQHIADARHPQQVITKPLLASAPLDNGKRKLVT